MAIYWVDPYLNTENGGVHGTVNGTTRNGTYEYPWTLNDTAGSAISTIVLPGDEVRLKGLPESSFFPTSVAWTAPTMDGTFVQRYNFDAAYQHKLVRLKDVYGNVYYACNANYSYIRPFRYGTTWQAGHPAQDDNYGFYPLLDKYELSTSVGGAVLFASFVVGIRITAGWTSQTEQAGVTVIKPRNGVTVFSSSTWYFGNTGNIDIDCSKLILAASYNQSLYVYGNYVRLKACVHAYYSPGYATYIYSGASSSYDGAYKGDVEIESAGGGGYTYIYSYYKSTGSRPTGCNIDIKHLHLGYSGNQISCTRHGSTLGVYNIKIGDWFGYYAYTIGGDGTLNLSGDAGWISEYSINNKTQLTGFTGVINESFGTPAASIYPVNTTSYLQFVYLTLSSNGSPTAPIQKSLSAALNSYIKKASISSSAGYRVFVSSLMLEEANSNLDTVSAAPLVFEGAAPYGAPARVNVMREAASGSRVQLFSPSIGGVAALSFNSPANSGKLTWRMLSGSNGLLYADTFSLSIPQGVTNGVSFSALFTTTNNPGVTINCKIYGVSAADGSASLIQTVSGVAAGTTVTCSASINQALLGGRSSFFVIVEALRSLDTACSVYFEHITVAAL